MRQQHPKRNFIAAGVLGSKFRQRSDYGSFKVQEAALIKDHRHGGGRDDLGEGGEIEHAFGRNYRRRWFVSELPEGFEGDELPVMCHCDGYGGECTMANRLCQDCECRGETFVLRGQVAR